MHVEVTHDTLELVTSWGQILEGALIVALGALSVFLAGPVLGAILVAVILTTDVVTHIALHDA